MYVVTRTGLGYSGPQWRPGFGDVSTGQVTGSAQNAASAVSDFTSSGGGAKYLKGSGAALLAAAPFAGPAAPFLAIAGTALELLGQMGVGSGCGQKCVLSTTYANKAEAIFQQNCNTYFALPAPRTVSQQQAALTIFDSIWLDLTQQCGVASLGDPGKRCISDRQSGACTWKQTGQSPWPGGPALGACWNWFNAYRDPIANDPVVPDTVASSVSGAATTLESALGVSSSSLMPLLLIGGLIVLAVSL
jgi:hypothetical protein